MMRGSAPEGANFETLIEVAVKRAPDYTPIWFAAMERYYPKYGNDPRAVERFGQMALKANTSAGPEMYARIYLHAWQEYKQDLYRVTGVDRRVLREAVFDLLKRFPDQHNFEVFGEMACGVGDFEMAAPILHRLQALPVEDHVWGEIANYQGCRSQIYHAQRRS